MAAARQEMADLLREVQKLQKELQPVRSAVTALQKREADTPNAAAAGASLKKVATRLESVKQKYKPYLTRLQELLLDEVPSYLQQTPLLAADAESLEHRPGGASRGTRNATNERLTAGSSSSVTKNTSDDAAHLLQQVCPPSTPHLLQPENLRFTHQQLRLRAEMVEYLIETNRIDIAEHLVREYGLPLQWFPRLVLLHRERIFGAAADEMESSQIPPPTGAAVGATVAPVAAGHSRPLPASSASPPVTPATRSRVAAVPPKSPIQLSLTASPKSSVTGMPTPSLPRSPAPQPTPASSAGASTPVGQHLNRSAPSPASSAHSPPTPQQQQRESGVASVLPSQAPSNAGTAGAATAPVTMPDLVARVVSTAMYLKDEYLDRMVLERTLEQHLGTAPSSESASATLTRGNSTPPPCSATPLERYKACVLSRIANIPRHHLHTQSGDDVFDSAIMNIIEDLLVYGLQKWAEVDAVTTADAEEASAESRKKVELQRTLTTDTLLTPQEMLLAEKVWSEEILLLKRPTRFYCVESGLTTEDGAASALAMPRARTSGEVVSKCVAISHDALDATVGIFIT
ncbi:conserved hypothetical protein [Leishmania major strain Friedlin]|uniref:Uncharacterized protein n=1 Tax=Leishmania major TaxID=5664 RepID=Q4Q367_LEIMA|nr:conserved hypothetical protein [Leishmania major strain Friedlin]CAG9581992.1 hypothetical_protein_-_conserved [Leishmania major strain Friedlin]CAJ07845.1 conserved hypothetical protein [Leishmania major strain Friedlin]|eukprot:XP_001686231.1 conserved hypothetical protein [Leishmania major strain Friedlin]